MHAATRLWCNIRDDSGSNYLKSDNMASMKNTSGACATRPKRKRIEAHRNAISMSPAMFQWLPDLLIRKSTLFKIKNAKSYWRSPATVATGSQIVWLFKSLTSCSTLFLHDVDLYAEICENFIQPELEKQFTSTWLDGLSHSCSEDDLPGELLQGVMISDFRFI